MISSLKKLWSDKRGNVLIIAAGALPLVIGSAGLASDTVQWVSWKRHLQRAADSAAFAGVYARMQSQTVTTAVATDLTINNHTGIALLAGYPTITYPAATSSYTNPVRVALAVRQQLGFSSIFMASAPTITATATAAIVPTGNYCVVSLENTSTTGILATGSTNLNLGCGMITNSTSMTAAIATGSSAVTASPIAAVGGIASSNNWAAGTTFLPFTIAQADPFAAVTPTAPSGCSPGGNLTVNSNQSVTLNPSLYGGTMCYAQMTLNGTVNLGAGVYYIDGGNLSIGAQATVTGIAGVVFVLSNRSGSSTATIGTVTMNGGATIKLVAPSSGPYQGIALYQDRRAVDVSGNNSPNKINGNSGSQFQGAFYFPKQELEVLGNAGMNTACMQMVARRVKFTGNSAISNVCPASSGAGSFKGQHVRLVG